MEFTVLSVLELHPQSPTAAMLKLGIVVVVVVCAYIISKLLLIVTNTNENIVMMVMMVPYPYVKL